MLYSTNLLHFPNLWIGRPVIPRAPEIPLMRDVIPSYELYGETETSRIPDLLHCESIAARSRMHEGDIRPHRHDGLLQFLFVRRGHIDATLEGAEVTLDGRFMIVIPALAVHGFDISDKTEGWVLTLPTATFEDQIQPAPHLAEFFSVPRVLRDGTADPAFDDMETLFQRVQDEYSSARPGRYFALRSTIGLLLVSIARAAPEQMRAGHGINLRKARQMSRFRERIERRFRQHDDIQTYASAIGVTPTHLNRICREITGKSALQTIHERIVIEAKRDLVYSTMAVSEIAAVLGYNDPAYFTRFFSRIVGQAPTRYREDARRELSSNTRNC